MSFKFRYINQSRMPKKFRKNSRIAMNEYMTHTYYVCPLNIIILFLEFQRQHIGSFSNYLNILYYCKIPQFV